MSCAFRKGQSVEPYRSQQQQETLGRVRHRVLAPMQSSNRRAVASLERGVAAFKSGDEVIVGRMELDSHADTIVAGRNCVVLHLTGRVCDVTPYDESYEAKKAVPIVSAATGHTCPVTGERRIIVLHEALSMPSLPHSLVNPNQLRYFGATVQDNPWHRDPVHIANPDGSVVIPLAIDGTTIFVDTWMPSQQDLEMFPHFELSSKHEWDPGTVTFPQSDRRTREELIMRAAANVSAVHHSNYGGDSAYIAGTDEETDSDDTVVFDMDRISRRIISSIVVSDIPTTDAVDTAVGEITAGASHGMQDVLPARTFISKDRHSDVSPEDLSDRWCISVAQAKLTLKATTQRLVRSAVMPLARRYRADRVFERPRFRALVATDTMDARVPSYWGNQYCQVFATKEFFAAAYPIAKKSDCAEALQDFIRDWGVPDKMIFDGSREQGGKHTKFIETLKKYDIDHHVTELQRSNENPAEGTIRELRKRWLREMFKKGVPRRCWDYGIPHVAEIMRLTASHSGRLHGRTPLELITGETPDISQWLDFGFWDRVYYKENAGLGEVSIGRFLGVAHNTGRLMSFWILPASGIVISRSTVQRITNLEMRTDVTKQRIAEYDGLLADRLKDDELRGMVGSKPDPNDWADLIDGDAAFAEEFSRVFNSEEVKEADDEFSPDSYDTYLNMELALDRGGENPEFARVTKRLKNKDGIPIGKANENPMLDTRIYEVEYPDGKKQALSANLIAQNLFAQCDSDGHRSVMFDSIIEHRTDGSDVKQQDAFIVNKHGAKRRVETTKGWEILVQWKDGSTTWSVMKDVKDSYPIQLAEYAVSNRISQEPAFAWWVPYVLKKRNRIIAKTKVKYWERTHKFGIKIPKSVEEALRFDAEDGNTLWWDAICKEMKVVRPAFEVHEGKVEDLVGYQFIRCHMIFDIKMGENFKRKARFVADGSRTETPASIAYSSVVSRDSVRIALTIAALNDLKVLACDIEAAYLTADCREKVYTKAGPEFGSDSGKVMVIRKALYGLKSSGAAFHALMAQTLHDMNYLPTKADQDVWIRPAVKPDGSEYYEMVLCYVDDLIAIGADATITMDQIRATFKLKDNKVEEPDIYLGAKLAKMHTASGTECWTMSAADYCKAAVENVEVRLAKTGEALPRKCNTPLASSYVPELDTTPELKADGLHYYQELIGVLRWAVEIGRVDILLEVSEMSTFLACPRIGHLQALFHVFGYLKAHLKRKLAFDPDHPSIDPSRFKKYSWEDFYRDAKEAIPDDMPKPRGKVMSTHCFEDASHASNMANRRSQTGILLFCNRAPVIWHSKKQNTVETSTFGSEFNAMKNAVELIEALRYKLRMFGVPIDGETNVFCDNEAVVKNVSAPESVLRKKHHAIAYHRCREAVAAGTIRIAKEGTETNLSDLFTKKLPRDRREQLLGYFCY